MRVGYARVSTDDQSLNSQLDALKAAGCNRIFTDKLSGKTRNRPGLAKALKAIAQSDTLIVWRLDRLGRSLSDLIDLVSIIQGKGSEFCSITESIETTTASGKLVFHIMAALAEFERRLISERTTAGLKAAKVRGVKLGRKPVLTAAKMGEARKLLRSGLSVERTAKRMKVGRSTLYHHLSTPASARIKGASPKSG